MCNGSTKTTNSSSTDNSTATTTPNVPSWISNPDQGYAGQVAGLMGANPQSFVAPASALQQQGFSATGNLGSWQDTLNQALGAVNSATSSPTPTYAATGYGATGYGATGYTPATVSSTPTIANTGGASAGTATASLISNLMSGSNLGGYLNPETGQVVDTTLAGMDKQAGADQAALAAKQALNKSFGGSGAAIESANLTNDQELTRAQEQATLEQQAFDKAAGLATTDAGDLTSTSVANAGYQTQASVASAQISAARAEAQAQLEQQTALANQSAQNAAGEFGASALNTAGQFGATATNAADQFGAAADNTASQANQQSALQMLQNMLSGASLTANIGTTQGTQARDDAGALLAAGQTQRGIAADQASAPLNFAAALKQLLGYDPSQFIGKTATGSDTKNSSSTETDTPSLMDTLGQIIGTGASLATGVPGTGFQGLFNSKPAAATGGTWFGG